MGSELDAAYSRARKIVRAAVTGGGWVLCLGHIQPDGDALGSALALGLAVRAAGGHAVVSFDSGPLGFGMPPSLGFLPGESLLASPEQVKAMATPPSAVITFDTGSAERLGSVAPFAEPELDGPPVLVIDHHARGTTFGSVRLIDARAAATAEIVAVLIDSLGVRLDQEIATCLYAALASDTGSFRYAATSPGSHQLAARLLEAGARHDEISALLWDTRPESYLDVLTTALGRLRCDGDIIWTYVGEDDLLSARASAEEAEGIVDVIRVAKGHEVAVVLKQDGPEWKASVRSRGRIDVGAACAALGGGGHRLSAGFGATGEPSQVIERLRAALASTA